MNRYKTRLKTSVVVLLVASVVNSFGALAQEPTKVALSSPTASNAVEYVNPFIGTADHGHLYPGATTPFGLVQLSPDTGTKGWDWCSGYHWSDKSIMGFSHTHISGTGCADLGDVLFMPTVGKVNLLPGTKEKPEDGYRSVFSHDDEKASPGFYSVKLKKYGVFAELTATPRVGVHRYTYPKSDQANVIIDLEHGLGDNEQPIALDLNIVGDHTITGMRRSKGWAPDQYVFFAAEFSKPFVTFGTATDETKPEAGSRHAQGKNVKGWITFNTGDHEAVIAKVGISTTSVEGAMRNLKAEMPDWNFDQVRQQTRDLWEKNLGKIRIEGGDKSDRETFYTALYHSMLAPQLISDVDRQFRGSDQQVHQTKDFDNYSTYSLWDTFRAEHPLFTILDPDRVNDMIKNFQVQGQFQKDKTLPIWRSIRQRNFLHDRLSLISCYC